jgi:hypothetical protein
LGEPPANQTLECSRAVRLCRSLCHNPRIPARVGPSRKVSLSHTRKAANVRKTRKNTAFLYHSVSLLICPYSFALGNGMEEVVGSIPTRSTKLLQAFNRSSTETPFPSNPRSDLIVLNSSCRDLDRIKKLRLCRHLRGVHTGVYNAVVDGFACRKML